MAATPKKTASPKKLTLKLAASKKASPMKVKRMSISAKKYNLRKHAKVDYAQYC